MKVSGDTGKGAGMLTDELLKLIQADRAREIAAADRVRWLRPEDAAETSGEYEASRLSVSAAPTGRRTQTGTATDPA